MSPSKESTSRAAKKESENALPVRVVRLPKQKPPQTKLKVIQKPRLASQSTVKKLPQVTRSQAPQLQVSPSPKPSPSPSPLASSPSPTPSPNPSASPEPADLLAAFAPDGATVTNCGNPELDCHQIDDTQWRSVAGNLTEEISRRGYTVQKLEELDDEHGMGIYKIFKQGKPDYYLHFLATDSGTTIYYLDRKPLNREELEQAIKV